MVRLARSDARELCKTLDWSLSTVSAARTHGPRRPPTDRMMSRHPPNWLWTCRKMSSRTGMGTRRAIRMDQRQMRSLPRRLTSPSIRLMMRSSISGGKKVRIYQSREERFKLFYGRRCLCVRYDGRNMTEGHREVSTFRRLGVAGRGFPTRDPALSVK